MLVDGTNKYAEEVIAEKERAGFLTPGSNWKPVTTSEMKAVLAVIINMGVVLKGSITGKPAGRAISSSSMMSFHATGLDYTNILIY